MALEPIPGNPEDFLPEDLVKANPEGTDSVDYGDNHIRLIKLALQNLDRLSRADLALLLNLFDDKGRVKLALKAKEAERLSSDFDLSQFALKDEDYENLRAKATTQGDVGLHRLANWALSRGFTPPNMANDEYLSVHSLKAFQAQVIQDIDDKLVGDVDLTDYAKVDGDYPTLRAKGTYAHDVGLYRLEGKGFLGVKDFKPQTYPPYSRELLVTTGYVEKVLDEENFKVTYPQSEHMLLDSWGGFEKTYSNERVAERLRTVTFVNEGNIDLKYRYWLEAPRFKVEGENNTGIDQEIEIRLSTSVVWKGILHPDNSVTTLTSLGYLIFQRRYFETDHSAHNAYINLLSKNSFSGRLRVSYLTGVGAYVVWDFSNMNRS